MSVITSATIQAYVADPDNVAYDKAGGLLRSVNHIKGIEIEDVNKTSTQVNAILTSSVNISAGTVSTSGISGSFNVEFQEELGLQYIPDGMLGGIDGLTITSITDVQSGGPLETYDIDTNNNNPKLVFVYELSASAGPSGTYLDITYDDKIRVDQESGYDVITIANKTVNDITNDIRVVVV